MSMTHKSDSHGDEGFLLTFMESWLFIDFSCGLWIDPVGLWIDPVRLRTMSCG